MSLSREHLVAACQQMLVAGVAAAVAVPAIAVVQLDVVPPGAAVVDRGSLAQSALVATAPVEPTIVEHELEELSDGAGAGDIERLEDEVAEAAHEHAGDHGDHGDATDDPHLEDQEMAVLSEPTPVSGYATVGVTWDPAAPIPEEDITVALRHREGEGWSDWTALEYDPAHGPDPGSPEAADARPGTGELLVGEVDEVQVAATTEDGEAPEGMTLAVVDPGLTPAEEARVEQPAIDTATLEDGSSTAGTTGADGTDGAEGTDGTVEGDEGDIALSATSARLPEAPVTPKPQIFSRAQWGANEALRSASSLKYFEVHAGFVHHTVNSNGYTREQVPALMRGIYAYHTQSRGWSDVGYNFIVDRFGRIWEGRYGGVDRPVVGAHTLGYNEYSFAMSALGNFDVARPPKQMVGAFARLFAWKLSLHGVAASSTKQFVGSRTFPAVNGHRDAGQTACPGRYLYAKVPEIQRRAAALQVGWSGRERTATVSGTTWPDLLLREEGGTTMKVLRTEGQLRFAKGRPAGPDLAGHDLVTPVGDVTRDGLPDLLARERSSGATQFFSGDGAGSYTPLDRRVRRFRAMDQLADAGDVNGDGRSDVVAVHPDGRMFLYRGRHGGLRKRQLMTRDAAAYRDVQGAGDLDGDGNEDLLARDADGQLLVLRGTGGRRLAGVTRMSGSWAGYDEVAAGHDMTGDGRSDVVARSRRTGRVYVFPVTGDARAGQGQGPLRRVRGVEDLWVVGDGGPGQLLVGRSRTGLVSFASNGRHNVSDVVDTNVDVSAASQLLNVGDWDGDGFGDVVVRERRYLKLWRGRADGRFSGPSRLTSRFAQVRLLAPAGDMTGDGRPDLIGQPRGSSMRLYPGGGSSVGQGYAAHSAIPGTRQLGVGRWDADGAPDSLVADSDGSLRLYPGNGPGGLEAPRRLAGNVGRLSNLVAVGDLDDNGKPDVVGVQDASGRLVQLSRTRKGLGLPTYVTDGFAGYDLIG